MQNYFYKHSVVIDHIFVLQNENSVMLFWDFFWKDSGSRNELLWRQVLGLLQKRMESHCSQESTPTRNWLQVCSTNWVPPLIESLWKYWKLGVSHTAKRFHNEKQMYTDRKLYKWPTLCWEWYISVIQPAQMDKKPDTTCDHKWTRSQAGITAQIPGGGMGWQQGEMEWTGEPQDASSTSQTKSESYKATLSIR